MNTGLQDAHNLAWKLALVVRWGVSPALLDSYEAERRPIAERVLRDTHRATQAATSRGILPQALRASALGLLAGIDLVQRTLLDRTSELDVSYRSSPIVTPHKRADGRLSAGDRIPDVRWGPQGSLARMLGARHLALLFDAGLGGEEQHARMLRVADMLATRFDGCLDAYVVLQADARPEWIGRGMRYLLDPTATIHNHLSIDAPAAIVIRPDGYLGYIGDPDITSLLSHLSPVLGTQDAAVPIGSVGE